jgi:S-adenosylmethionine/arginine decarboxylase-like enzyme
MLDDANPLPNPFPLPPTSCGDGGHYKLHYETEMSWSGSLNLKKALLECSDGTESINLVAKEDNLTEEQKNEVEASTKRIIDSLGDLDEEVPTNTDELQSIVGDVQHPVTATILSELVQLVSGMSGVSVFSLVTTILQTIIMSPSGWAYVPAIMYVIFSHGKEIAGKDLQEAHSKFEELDQKFEEDDLAKENYSQKKREIVADHF